MECQLITLPQERHTVIQAVIDLNDLFARITKSNEFDAVMLINLYGDKLQSTARARK